MIINRQQRKTEFSPCRRYRYTLWREWDEHWGLLDADPGQQGYLMVIGLNPSTADETQDDPTIRRCIGFAKRWGFGALCMTNLFAWRNTDPLKMKVVGEPIGYDNDRWLKSCATSAGMVLAAWGKHGSHLGRASRVFGSINNAFVVVHALKINKDGSPQHPLYVPKDTIPVIYTP